MCLFAIFFNKTIMGKHMDLQHYTKGYKLTVIINNDYLILLNVFLRYTQHIQLIWSKSIFFKK